MNKSIDMQVHNESELHAKSFPKATVVFFFLFFDLLGWKNLYELEQLNMVKCESLRINISNTHEKSVNFPVT